MFEVLFLGHSHVSSSQCCVLVTVLFLDTLRPCQAVTASAEIGLVVLGLSVTGLLAPRDPYVCMYRQYTGKTVTLQGGR